jgi:DMSO/TMAO reductase YedYZ molybdopterin-dependent catalytic subunit
VRLPGLNPSKPPPGPFREGFWRSPLRGAWLTAVLGLVLLIGLPIVIVTGLFSNDAYQPGLGSNALGRNIHGPLDFYLFGWPAHPTWLYALSQGLHVTVGLALFPVVLAKLWSVIPRLFEWPPVRSPAHLLERLSLALLVGGALFEFVTGILNIQYWYVFPFSFVQAHYYGAWVFIGAFIAHVTLKFGTMRRSLRTRREVVGGLPAPPRASVRGEPSLVAASRSPRRCRAGRCSERWRRDRCSFSSRAPPSRSAARCAAWPSFSRAGASAQVRSASPSIRRRWRRVSPVRRSVPGGT